MTRNRIISDPWLAHLPYPKVDEEGQMPLHLHHGADGVDDPLCYPCHDAGYEAGIEDAAWAMGATTELVRSILNSSSMPFEPYRGPQRFFLYWLYGVDDRLLYVGVTRNLRGRMTAHRKNWGDVIHRIEHEEYPDHRSVLKAESAEIAAKCPPFNCKGVGVK